MRHVVSTGNGLAPSDTYFTGLDLGQVQDPSAVAVVQRRCLPRAKAEYTIGHLRRFELGTPYTSVIAQMVELLDKTAPADAHTRPLRGCVLGLDQTGVGRPVVDMFKAARPPCQLNPVTITAGKTATLDSDGWAVPKKDLVAVVQLLLQSRRLKWDVRLPHAKDLARELADFQVRITASANEQFGAWREGSHDDLVLAVAIACWLAERLQPTITSRPFSGSGMAKVQGTLHHGNGFFP
jgi:hypothetical protein